MLLIWSLILFSILLNCQIFLLSFSSFLSCNSLINLGLHLANSLINLGLHLANSLINLGFHLAAFVEQS